MGILREESGKRVRGFRTAKGFTLETLSDLANMGTSHLDKVELGKKNFKIDSLEKILQALDVPADTFFQFDNDIEKPENPIIDKTVAIMKTLSVEDQEYIYQTVVHLRKIYKKRDQME